VFRPILTSDAYDKLHVLLVGGTGELLVNDERLTPLDNKSEKCVQDESKIGDEVTQDSEVEEHHRLPQVIGPPYMRGGLEAQGRAVSAAEGRVRRDLAEARLGKWAGGGDGRGECEVWGVRREVGILIVCVTTGYAFW
jgi:hypothetical protein